MSRRRFVQRKQSDGSYKLEEVPVNFVGRRRSLPDNDMLVSEKMYDGVQAQDGADISSRAKYKRYCKENAVTHPSDFAGHWETHARSEQLKETKARREHVERALFKLDPP